MNRDLLMKSLIMREIDNTEAQCITEIISTADIIGIDILAIVGTLISSITDLKIRIRTLRILVND